MVNSIYPLLLKNFIIDTSGILVARGDGNVGLGKSHLLQAICHTITKRNPAARVLYLSCEDFTNTFINAIQAGALDEFRNLHRRVDVLVIDDWALSPLTDLQRRDILEVVEDRHGSRSTVLASQLPVEKWHDYLADPTIADAVLDRLVHNAHRIKPKGPTRRKPEENAKR